MSAESIPTDRLIGQILAERYEILHRLGEGAMGVVYKARHVKVGRAFAVKVLHARLLTEPKVAQRFEREAELAGRLRHPNVVGVVDVGEIDDMHYMVMDFAEGPDLAQLLVEAPMPPERIIALVRPMLEGLYHAHEHGLIHRDFKPENVIIERDSRGGEMPRIVDFGIALLREGGDAIDGQGRLTTNGLVLGTPHYMAPEQAVADPIDHRIDLFALGIVIYEMLSGRLPFDGSGAEVARANLLLEPPPIAQRVPYLEVDPLLEAFARRLMAKKRDARPADAHAARELLDLIERDRRAAGIALGVAPELSERAPAITQPVFRHGRTPMTDERTAPMRPPSPAVAEPPRLLSIPIEPSQPNVRAVDPPPPPSEHAPRPAPTPSTPPPAGPPMVFSAPAWGLSPPPEVPDRETVMRTPLHWPPTPAPRRRSGGWILGGVALGAAGIAVAWLAMRSTPPAPRSEPHVQLSTIQPAAPPSNPPPVETKAPSDPPPVEVKPPSTRPVEPAPVTATVTVPPTPTVAAPTTPTVTAPTTHPAKRVAMRDPKPRPPTVTPARPPEASHPVTRIDPAAPATKPSDPPPVAPPVETKPVTPDPAPPPAKPVEHKAAKPAAVACDTSVPPMSGIEPNAISTLYYKVAKSIGGLPPDQSQDLWGRFSRFNVNVLMAAPQTTRDEAAVLLSQIDKEAGCRRAR